MASETSVSATAADGAEGADGAEVATGAEVAKGDPGLPESPWSERPWYRTNLGLGVVAIDILLTIGLALGTAGVYDDVVQGFVQVQSPVVPLGVYGFSLLGALGFVFTALLEKFDCNTSRLLRYNLRLPAALPLGAGMYVLSGIILGSTTATAATESLIIGLVFLSGLYVNLAYKRLGALARRLLPQKKDAPASSGDETSDTSSVGTASSDSTTTESGTQSTTSKGPGGTAERPGKSVEPSENTDSSGESMGDSTEDSKRETESPPRS